MFTHKKDIFNEISDTYRALIYAHGIITQSSTGYAKQEHFVKELLSPFLNACSEILPFITLKDIESIGTDNPTLRIQQLLILVQCLKVQGFDNLSVTEKPRSFWSGRKALSSVLENNEVCVDVKLPVFCMLFSLSQAIAIHQQAFTPFNLFLNHIFSKLYASSVKGVVHVFISSDKDSEHSGLEVGNCFWTMELQQIQIAYAKGTVTDILIHLYDHTENKWIKPLSLFDANDQKSLPVRRRSFHPTLDLPSDKNKFRTNPENPFWKSSASRPTMRFHDLRRMALKFKSNCQLHASRDRVGLNLKSHL